MIIYDVTEFANKLDEKEEKRFNEAVTALTKIIHPNTEFFLVHIDRIVKKGEEYDGILLRSVLCDEEALDLLLPYTGLFFVGYKNGKSEFYRASGYFSDETRYKMQEDFNLAEDEVFIVRRIDKERGKIEKIKLSELPIKPFPEITDEMIVKAKKEMAEEELKKAKENIETKYGVKL